VFSNLLFLDIYGRASIGIGYFPQENLTLVVSWDHLGVNSSQNLPGGQFHKTFSTSNKLECLPLTTVYSLGSYLLVMKRSYILDLNAALGKLVFLTNIRLGSKYFLQC
jgi:hypothetical protein